MYSPSCQDVDEFVSLLEQIWRNLALHHLLTSGSSAVNGCRQNESSIQNFSKSVLIKKKLIYLLDGLRASIF